MAATGSVGARIDKSLVIWLKKEAEQKNCSVNDLLKEAILLYKQFNDVPRDLQFSHLLHVRGAKAAIMTYRLLERFIRTTLNDGKEIIDVAGAQGLKEIDQWKIKTTE